MFPHQNTRSQCGVILTYLSDDQTLDTHHCLSHPLSPLSFPPFTQPTEINGRGCKEAFISELVDDDDNYGDDDNDNKNDDDSSCTSKALYH